MATRQRYVSKARLQREVKALRRDLVSKENVITELLTENRRLRIELQTLKASRQ